MPYAVCRMAAAAAAAAPRENNKNDNNKFINLTQLTNIILQNLVSLGSYLALDINILGFIFTCIVFSVSLA
jgi:hypothetical protein